MDLKDVIDSTVFKVAAHAYFIKKAFDMKGGISQEEQNRIVSGMAGSVIGYAAGPVAVDSLKKLTTPRENEELEDLVKRTVAAVSAMPITYIITSELLKKKNLFQYFSNKHDKKAANEETNTGVDDNNRDRRVGEEYDDRHKVYFDNEGFQREGSGNKGSRQKNDNNYGLVDKASGIIGSDILIVPSTTAILSSWVPDLEENHSKRVYSSLIVGTGGYLSSDLVKKVYESIKDDKKIRSEIENFDNKLMAFVSALGVSGLTYYGVGKLIDNNYQNKENKESSKQTNKE